MSGQQYMDHCLQMIEKLQAHRDDLSSVQKVALTRIIKGAKGKYAEGDWRELIERAEKLMPFISGSQVAGADAR